MFEIDAIRGVPQISDAEQTAKQIAVDDGWTLPRLRRGHLDGDIGSHSILKRYAEKGQRRPNKNSIDKYQRELKNLAEQVLLCCCHDTITIILTVTIIIQFQSRFG
jgi:hypothetical protein